MFSGSPAEWSVLCSLLFHVFHLPSDLSDLMESVSHLCPPLPFTPASGCVLAEHLANNHHINEEVKSPRGLMIC